jgi:diadenosine tetraphosphatase ApaH/serine/threonine PP2A family protein phosphatase
MRYLVFSDVHGNIEALEQVLEEARLLRPDMIVSLGDVVGYGASPDECVRLVDECARIRIGGNHDLAAAGLIGTETFGPLAQRAIQWTARRISSASRDALGEYDTMRRYGECVFAHASPVSPMQWEYILTLPQASSIFARISEKYIFIGHTHVPGIVEHHGVKGPRIVESNICAIGSGSRYLINAGSIGQPRDGIAAASFALLDTKRGTITIRRVPYDIRSAQEKIRTVGLPESLAARLATAR